MSNIPQARAILEEVIDYTDDYNIKRRLGKALQLMHRVSEIRRASEVRQVINSEMRAKVRNLVHTTDLTMHQVATKVGLRNGGRVSEIMHGKR